MSIKNKVAKKKLLIDYNEASKSYKIFDTDFELTVVIETITET